MKKYIYSMAVTVRRIISSAFTFSAFPNGAKDSVPSDVDWHSKFADGAFIVTAIGAVLYLFGTATLGAIANETGATRHLVAGDLFSTLSLGVESLLIVLSLPDFVRIDNTRFEPEFEWLLLLKRCAMPGALLLVFLAWHSFPARRVLVVVFGILMMHMALSYTIPTIVDAYGRYMQWCISDADCRRWERKSLKIVSIEVSGGEKEEIEGILAFSSDRFFGIFTKDGCVLVPFAAVKGARPIEEPRWK